MSEYGVTGSGFQKKRFDTIYNEICADLLTGLGIDISLNPQSVINVITATYADRLARLWDLAEAVYNSQFPASATGVALDNACSYANIKRRVSEPTKYNVLYVQAGTSIGVYPAGTQAATQGSEVRYMSSTQACSLNGPGSAASYWKFTCPSTSGTVVSLDFGTTSASYTTTGDVSADNLMVRNMIYPLPGTGSPFIVGSDDEGITIRCDDSTLRSVGYINMVPLEYGVLCPFEDNTPGDAGYNGAVTVTTTNPILRAECRTVSRGTLYESDEDFRKRYLRLMASRGCASVEAIRSQVLEVPGVQACDVAENKTNTAAGGIPAHGVKIYVDQADGSTYDELSVAEAIYRSMSAGINMETGGRSATVTDYAGNPVLISWVNPVTMNEYVQISITANGTLANNYSATAKSLFMEYVGKPKMGDAVDLQAIAAKIKDAINGAGYVEIACMQIGDSTYSRKFLASVRGQKYNFSEERITVVTA
jgi:uncharacterized phage protein gp47/JayE